MMTMSGAQSQQLLSCGLVCMEGCNHTLQSAALRQGIFLSDEDDEWSAKSTTENLPSYTRVWKDREVGRGHLPDCSGLQAKENILRADCSSRHGLKVRERDRGVQQLHRRGSRNCVHLHSMHPEHSVLNPG